MLRKLRIITSGVIMAGIAGIFGRGEVIDHFDSSRTTSDRM